MATPERRHTPGPWGFELRDDMDDPNGALALVIGTYDEGHGGVSHSLFEGGSPVHGPGDGDILLDCAILAGGALLYELAGSMVNGRQAYRDAVQRHDGSAALEAHVRLERAWGLLELALHDIRHGRYAWIDPRVRRDLGSLDPARGMNGFTTPDLDDITDPDDLPFD